MKAKLWHFRGAGPLLVLMHCSHSTITRVPLTFPIVRTLGMTPLEYEELEGKGTADSATYVQVRLKYEKSFE